MTVEQIDTRELLDELRGLVGGDEDHWDAEVVAELDDDEKERAEEIRTVLDEIGDEARYGAQMIREDSFVEYAQEFAEEVGAVNSDNAWPVYCIDWNRAADELRVDYTSVTFDGHDWLVRA